MKVKLSQRRADERSVIRRMSFAAQLFGKCAYGGRRCAFRPTVLFVFFVDSFF